MEPNRLIQSMIEKSGEELRKLGEHALADGDEVFDPERFIRDAHAFSRAKAQAKPKVKKAKQQKAARRKNRK